MARRTRNRRHADPADDDSRELRPSRSERKRQAERLTQLGVKLTELSPKTLAGLEMDDELSGAIETCRALKRGSARMRQIRLIGKLLRKHDTEEIIATLIRSTSGAWEKAALAKVQEDQRGGGRRGSA